MTNRSRYARGKAIESAEAVAAFRAIGTRERDPGLRNPDTLARRFLGLKYGLMARFHKLTKLYAERAFPGMYWYFLARTKHLDHLLATAVAEGAEQVVLLGAGYDTRACRFEGDLAGTQVFEVDLRATQERKRARLDREPPSNVTYVDIDFTRQSLRETLVAAGFDPNRKTFFNWEGVTYYLPEHAVLEVLEFVRTSSARGSTIAFDYMLRSLVDGDTSTYGSAQVLKGFRRVREPARFGIRDEDTQGFLEERGFRLRSDCGPSDLEGMYLRGADGARRRLLGCMRIAYAEVA